MYEHHPEDGVHRFSPETTTARRDNYLVALLVGCLTVGLLYWGRGEADPLILLLFAGGAGVLTYVFYAWQGRRRLQSIEITDTELTVHGPEGTRRLDWREIVRADHTCYGGERWIFRIKGVNRPAVLRMDGYTGEEVAIFRSLVEEQYRSR